MSTVNVFLGAGFTLKESCLFAGLSRSRYYEIQKPGKVKNADSFDTSGDHRIIETIKGLKAKHPFWGYRRVHAWLVHREEDWKRALDMAFNIEFPCVVRGQGLKLVSDNGCQPTSISFRNSILIYHRGHRVHGGFVVIHFINSVLLCVLCGLK